MIRLKTQDQEIFPCIRGALEDYCTVEFEAFACAAGERLGQSLWVVRQAALIKQGILMCELRRVVRYWQQSYCGLLVVTCCYIKAATN